LEAVSLTAANIPVEGEGSRVEGVLDGGVLICRQSAEFNPKSQTLHPGLELWGLLGGGVLDGRKHARGFLEAPLV